MCQTIFTQATWWQNLWLYLKQIQRFTLNPTIIKKVNLDLILFILNIEVEQETFAMEWFEKGIDWMHNNRTYEWCWLYDYCLAEL